MTVEDVYNKVNKTKEYQSIWVFSMDGMTKYAFINAYYKFDTVPEEIKKREVEVITIGTCSLFLKI